MKRKHSRRVYPTLGQIWDYALELGVQMGHRDAEAVRQVCERNKARYAGMSAASRRLFDKTRLKIPFGDCRIYIGDRNKKIRGMLVTIDATPDTALHIEELNAEHGWNIDLLFAHHAPNKWTAHAAEDFCVPSARCLADLYGVPRKHMRIIEFEARKMARKVGCGMGSSRYMPKHMKIMGVAAMCRQIDVVHVSIHTPCDEFIWRAVWEVLGEAKPGTCGDAMDVLYRIPEFRRFRQQGHLPIHMLAGKPRNRLGRWYNGNSAATLTLNDVSIRAIKEAGFDSMVGVIYEGAMAEAARKYGLNVIHLPHDPSDSVGINGLLDRLVERWPALEVLAHGTFFRVERPKCGAWTEAAV